MHDGEDCGSQCTCDERERKYAKQNTKLYRCVLQESVDGVEQYELCRNMMPMCRGIVSL